MPIIYGEFSIAPNSRIREEILRPANATEIAEVLEKGEYIVDFYLPPTDPCKVSGCFTRKADEWQIFSFFPENNSITSTVLQTIIPIFSKVQSTIREITVTPTEQSAVSAIDTDDHSTNSDHDFKINQTKEKR